MKKILTGDAFTLGVCYYPEHWPKEMWREDLRRMHENGIEVIRIAEFAWNLVEPNEGVFNYDFFDEFLDVTEEVDMKVIFCTPTATPPAWLTTKYPEVLNATMEGVKFEHGQRRQYNYNAPIYRELTERITEKFASHYGQRPTIIGWQIDNEINCEMNVFYSQADKIAFQRFLQEKYKTLDVLNSAWGTVFWNQTYTSWDEIDVPRSTVSKSPNPHRVLDFYRFISASALSYAGLQAEIIKAYKKPDDFITTNGMFGHMDNHKMNRESLDFYTYDSYPNFAYSINENFSRGSVLKDRNWSRNLMEVRSISPEFGIMEQQSGANGWNTGMEAPSPRPGQLTLWTMQSIAHGADFISYFRWRTCTFGTEMYWHGILDYSSRDNRRLAEVKSVRDKLTKIKPVAGGKYVAEVALLKDYDNVWDAEVDVWHGGVTKISEESIFVAAQRSHTPLDTVYLDETSTLDMLKPYKVIFYPHPSIITDERLKLLETYVAEGGRLIFGARSGYKTIEGQCVREKLPGKLKALTGVDIPEYTAIANDSEPMTSTWDGEQLESVRFLDFLVAEGAQAELLTKVTSGDYIGAGNLVRNSYGKGEVYYFGSAFSESDIRVFLKKLEVIEPYKDMIELPNTCELAVRKSDRPYYFVLNYLKTPATIKLNVEMTDLITGKNMIGDQEIEPYGVMVLKRI